MKPHWWKIFKKNPLVCDTDVSHKNMISPIYIVEVLRFVNELLNVRSL
jgi:hypothetical protein